MKIETFEVMTLEIPMRISVEHALAKRQTARNVVVVVKDESGGTGWGESCPRPYVTGETVESARDDLRDIILPQLVGMEFSDLDEIPPSLLGVLDSLRRDQQAAFCACELAVLDLAGKAFGVSAGTVLGPVRSQQVRYSGVIASEEPAGVRQQAAMTVKFGVREVKVKLGGDLDKNRAVLRAAREALGRDAELRVDANCAWSGPEAVRQLEALAEFRLAGVEQPVKGEDIDGMRTVTAAGLAPVVADESLASVSDAETLIREKACDIFNIRISKCGGLANSGRLYRMAKEAGLSCQLGAQVGETGFLSAAGRHVATRCEGLRWLEGSYDRLLLEENVTEPDITVGPGGTASALDSAGLGVAPIKAQIERFGKDRFRVA